MKGVVRKPSAIHDTMDRYLSVMKNEIQKAVSQIASTLKETLSDLGDSAKEKSLSVIDNWLDVFPELESMGLVITSFGVSLAISPGLEVELSGPAGLFDHGKLQEYRQKYEKDLQVSTVLRAIQTTKQMYHKLGKKTSDEIYLKIKVKVPPEVGVFFGKPSIP
jgi:hypothetical protein